MRQKKRGRFREEGKEREMYRKRGVGRDKMREPLQERKRGT